ncbi:MAG TPA: fumarylacetoacetate hydrolase family protein [Candidatus Limnocylindrales bacterium]|nr:fumarylacetoacetate hydrolase family protein [Candidatus Limnocylindrales bacterium]
MRIITYRDGAADRLGVVADDHALPADALLPSGPTTMAALLAGGPGSLQALAGAAADAGPRIAAEGTLLSELELLSPVPRPGKVVAIGLNYFAHAAEQGTSPPEEPLVFAKFTTAVVGHGAEIRWDPALTGQVDYEAELAVVIGRTARRVGQAEALAYVLGYTCANDVSARDLQFGDRQWVRGKSLDTFCPLGPVLVTSDEIPDPQVLSLSCTVSGERLQEGSTADMIFPVARLVSHCSQAFTLEPGDVIVTGTPPGVGVHRTPQRFLRDGDVVEVEIEGIGRLVNVCHTEPASAG